KAGRYRRRFWRRSSRCVKRLDMREQNTLGGFARLIARNRQACFAHATESAIWRSMMRVTMPMIVSMRRRVEIDFVRRPVEHALQPAAEQGDPGQQADIAELPPKIRQPHKP